jgi:hypothetical protein
MQLKLAKNNFCCCILVQAKVSFSCVIEFVCCEGYAYLALYFPLFSSFPLVCTTTSFLSEANQIIYLGEKCNGKLDRYSKVSNKRACLLIFSRRNLILLAVI